MPDATGTPPSGAIDVAAFKAELLGEFKSLLGAAVGEAIKPIATSIGQLQEGHKTLAGSIIKAEDIGKVIDEKIGGAFKTQQQTSEAAAKKTALRQKVLAAKGLDKLKPSLLSQINLPDSDNEEELSKAADALVKDLNESGVKLANVGGAQGDGGASVTQQQQAAAVKQGGFLKMPGAAA